MNDVLKVLVLEDNPDHAELMVHELRRAGLKFEYERVDSEADYLDRLEGSLDLILADYSLPQFTALKALEILNTRHLDIPFIIVTGSLGDEAVFECIKLGAADLLLKDRLARLGPAIQKALNEKNLKDQKQMAEEALRQSEERYRSLFEFSPLGIALIRDGILLYANPALAILFGYKSATDMTNMPLLPFISPADQGIVTATFTSVMRTLSSAAEVMAQRIDNGPFPIRLDISRIELTDGPAFVAFMKDITERKHLEAERLNAERLRVELEKEKELTDLKERFTSMVSHEFRTPLTVIFTHASLMERYWDRFTPEKHIHYLQDIQAQIKYMDNLLDDVLTMGTANAGKMIFHAEPMNIEAFCLDMFEQIQLGDQDNHVFAFSNPNHVTQAFADRQLLRHILINLLSNAVKYTTAGGEVRFMLDRQEGSLIFEITDQGIGIPEEDLSRLFEAFHRANNVGNIKGTGLGLAIVKDSVEVHGGTISVESEVGVGTTFTVILPILTPVGSE